MALLTRIFGKRIQGEDLDNVLKNLGHRSAEQEMRPLEKWTASYHGRLRTKVKGDGIEVDLYLFREMYHNNDGTIGLDFENGGTPMQTSCGGRRSREERFYTRDVKHYQGLIPYSDLAEELTSLVGHKSALNRSAKK
ncbi:hypothetical protein FJZ18_02515 [Candidatus Pacearchaeota archaeon]|nr:hypothetical protein [Candidatus Pacearchaeota archaeon]